MPKRLKDFNVSKLGDHDWEIEGIMEDAMSGQRQWETTPNKILPGGCDKKLPDLIYPEEEEDIYDAVAQYRKDHPEKDIYATNDPRKNTGLDGSYYDLPEGASQLQDLIEYKDMNFAVGNIFKATYRLNDKATSTYNLEKIIFYAIRELKRSGELSADKLSDILSQTN